jgi:hypothetical protein
MYLNTDELLLLSRGGRVPPVSRAGPRYRDWLSPLEREGLRVVRSWGLRSARRRRAAQLRKALGQLGAGSVRGTREPAREPDRESGREPARAPSVTGYADRESYVELEFAVGFAVEDEQLL